MNIPSSLLLCNKLIQKFKAENNNDLLFLLMLWVKNPSKAQLGHSPAPRGIGWVHSLLSAGGQAVLEGPGRRSPTSGSSRLLHAASHCPHGISSFSSSVSFFIAQWWAFRGNVETVSPLKA